MLKLYRSDESACLYWECWKDGRSMVIHSGTVGDKGKTQTVTLKRGQTEKQFIDEAARPIRKEKYRTIPESRHEILVLRYPIGEEPTAKDVDRGERLENLCNECLGWTGNGYCDGHDLGEGSLAVYCCVVQVDAAVQTVLKELKKKRLLRDALLGVVRDRKFEILYPEECRGVFDT